MATATVTRHEKTRHQKAVRSSVVLKAVMAVSGLIMVGYLLAHMAGNLHVFGGAEEFNTYAADLRRIGEGLIPYGLVLWIARIVLLLSVVGHIYSAIVLSRRSHRATGKGKRYQSKSARRGVQRSYASFTMRWGGLTIFLFVLFHLMHLTWKWINPGGGYTPYDRVVLSFQNWWMVALYAVALILVCLHIRHGVWSALTTLGLNTSVRARRTLNVVAVAVAGILLIGFLLPPFSILLGLVK
ncbi:MAG: succinate dehydrogenase cytochrome b subunit [Propionibacteriales bacterium]|nr:succinate dehydrogenase cytochrome b subunit [Propionibacteriales bacterium]